MKFSGIIASALIGASTALATPAYLAEKRQTAICSGTYSNAQCCATNVLNLADLNCVNPPTEPTSMADFINICAAIGQQALCCALPILGQALLCNAVE
ncbi:magnaporin [Glonium stellatum]|uniref:Magnaporin n=1 Tax=Glonium stellatum TaxID=574774 RepID=A0A8E2JT34_9PEZI|nr:magnaporin [Glonium stellatum]